LNTSQNYEGNVEHLSSKLTYGKEAIEWRRSKVIELASQGYSQHEIAAKLQIAKGTVSSDLTYLRQQAQDNLQKHIHEVVPEEYQKCMVGMKRNLKQVLEIAEGSSDPKLKLEARRIANDCYRYIMDLCTNAGIVGEALNYVTQSQQKISALQKLDDRINNNNNNEAEAAASTVDEQTTTNGVF
jgi:hypothetical protein